MTAKYIFLGCLGGFVGIFPFGAMGVTLGLPHRSWFTDILGLLIIGGTVAGFIWLGDAL